MGAYIDKINAEIQQKGESIIKGIQDKVAAIRFPESNSKSVPGQFDKPSRPFFILSIIALIVFAILMLSSEEKSEIYYLIVVAAVVSFIWGRKTQQNHEEKIKRLLAQYSIDFDSIRNECKKMVNSIVDESQKEWSDFMTVKKAEVQQIIDNSDLSSEKKSAAKSNTYMYNEFAFVTKDVIDQINDLPENNDFASKAKIIISNFADKCKQQILQVVKDQMDTYSKINL
ncbi:MAG: hypothetical protein Q4B61_00845 [Bacteroidales bacterium]|nr:hypothetical protein [Bacteroidales bacterium]